MVRKEGWELRIEQLFTETRRKPFAWGQCDGLIFAAQALDALLLTAYAAQWTGFYSTESEAWLKLRDYLSMPGADSSTLIDALYARIGEEISAPEINRSFARRGDIAIVAGQAGHCFAIVAGGGRHLYAMSPLGMMRLPLSMGITFRAVGV